MTACLQSHIPQKIADRLATLRGPDGDPPLFLRRHHDLQTLAAEKSLGFRLGASFRHDATTYRTQF